MKQTRTLIALAVCLALCCCLAGAAAAQETLRYAGKFFEFKHHRLVFIDIVDKSGKQIGPMIIDKKGGPQDLANYQLFPLNETGAFILRLVLQDIDPKVIKDIYVSAYNVTEAVAIGDINKFLDTMTTQLRLLNVRTKPGKTRVDPLVSIPAKFNKPLAISLDVDLNQMGGGGFKIPPR